MKNTVNINNRLWPRTLLQRTKNQGRFKAECGTGAFYRSHRRGFGMITVAIALIFFAALLKFWAFALVREYDAARAQGLFLGYQSYARAARLTGLSAPQSLIPHYAGMPDGVTLSYVSDTIAFDFSALPLAQRLILRQKLRRWLSRPALSSVSNVPVLDIPTDRSQYILRAGDHLFADLKFEGSNTITGLKSLKVNSMKMTTLNAGSVKLLPGSLLTVTDPLTTSAPFSADLFTVRGDQVPQLRADQIQQTNDGQLVTPDLRVTGATTIVDMTVDKLTLKCDEDEVLLECDDDGDSEPIFINLKVTERFTLEKDVDESWKFTNLASDGASVGTTSTKQLEVTKKCIGC